MNDSQDRSQAYSAAYDQADKALNGIKRLRDFSPAEDEAGMKDSLSGKRQALLTRADEGDAKKYWRRIAGLPGVSRAQVRPGGKERLDAIGLIKRFWPTGFSARGYLGFPSTSSIAIHYYLERLQTQYEDVLKAYHNVLRPLGPWKVRENSQWPYDGDLLYPGGLDDFERSDERDRAEATLKEVWKAAGSPPTYYAIVVMDGDSMGARIQSCLKQPDAQKAHSEFSNSLTDFSRQVPRIVEDYGGFLVYNGGDDVLYFCPLETALISANALATAFKETGTTASAGIAIVHHTHPLGAALREAHLAEEGAKQFPDKLDPKKDAVCIRAVKRSGVTLQAAANWQDVPAYVEEITGWFQKSEQGSPISRRFAYDWKRNTYALPASGPMVQWEINRLLDRHRAKEDTGASLPNPAHWAERLDDWAKTLPGGSDEVADWILLARFLAQGGGEE